MKDNTNKKGFAKWLETLQQESWQLELIISGFAIFLLLGLYEPITNWNYQTQKINYINTGSGGLFLLDRGAKLLFIAWYVLVINLIFHVLLRGFWISTIGLRYVSGNIDFESLDFSKNFDQFLRKNVSNFDDYIERLEKICSVIFSFTFLVLFIIISFGSLTLVIVGLKIIGYYFEWEIFTSNIEFPFLVGGAIYALDFITLGWIKKQRNIATIYYPIYRLYSLVTLSFLYRPLYYNLVDNKFGRLVGLLIIPYVAILLTFSSVKIDLYNYLPWFRGKQVLNISNYDETRLREIYLQNASIPSKYVKNGFLEIFLPYNPNRHDSPLAELCPGLKPGNAKITLDYFREKNDNPRRLLNADSTLNCFSQLHQIFIDDSLRIEAQYRFYYHSQREEEGLLTILDIGNLSRGEHVISIKSKERYFNNKRDSLVFKQQDIIPFWKE